MIDLQCNGNIQFFNSPKTQASFEWLEFSGFWLYSVRTLSFLQSENTDSG